MLHRLSEFVDIIDAARRVHPAGVGVEALVDEELTPRRRAIDVQTLVAGYLLLGAEEVAGVRIDQKQRLAATRQRRRDGNAVRALSLSPGSQRRGDWLA